MPLDEAQNATATAGGYYAQDVGGGAAGAQHQVRQHPFIVRWGKIPDCVCLIAAMPGRRSEPVIKFTKSRKTSRATFFFNCTFFYIARHALSDEVEVEVEAWASAQPHSAKADGRKVLVGEGAIDGVLVGASVIDRTPSLLQRKNRLCVLEVGCHCAGAA